MMPPFVSYVTFNRLGLTIRNLSALLDSSDDFDMHIIDNSSKDNTWDYIMSLNDSRIRTRQRFEINHGKTYALNLQLVRRLPEQYFFSLDNGVLIETKNWIGKFLSVFEAYQEVGLLGVVPDDNRKLPLIHRQKDAISYLELTPDKAKADQSYIPGFCIGLRPELIKEIGYFSEENYFEDIDLTYRVCHHTIFKAGIMTGVQMQLPNTAECGQCAWREKCTLDKIKSTCLTKFEKDDKEAAFRQKFKWKFDETVRDMESGARPVYCASLIDSLSTKEHVYNKEWAMENISYFLRNAN